MGTVKIEGEEYDVPDAVCDLLCAVSKERDELREIARDVVCCTIEHLHAQPFRDAMEPICNRAHAAIAAVSDA